MADKPKVIDGDTEVHVDYKTDIAKYQRLEKLASDKLTQLNAQKDQAAAQQKDLQTQQATAQKDLAEVDNAMRLSSRHIQNLERERGEVQPDDARAQQIENELATERARLDDYSAKHHVAQAAVTSAQEAIASTGAQITDLTEQARVTENARFNYANTVEYAQEADRYQGLSDVAGGGDPDQIRHAVLAAADEYADKFHQLSATQAKTFEDMNAAQSHLKGMQDELTISQRAQTKIEADIKAAQAAGHDDEVESLQKELAFRVTRTGDLASRIAQQEPVVKDLQQQNTVQNDELMAAKQQSEEFRGMARGNPDELERQFTDKQMQADHNTEFFRPQAGSDEETLGKQLETEANTATQPATGTEETENGAAPTDATGTDVTGTDATTQPTGEQEGEEKENTTGEEPTGSTTQTPTDTTTQPTEGEQEGEEKENTTGTDVDADATSGATGTTTDTTTQPTEGEQEAQEPPAGNTNGEADPGANLDGLDESGNVESDNDRIIDNLDTPADAAPTIVDSDMLSDPQATNPPDVDTPASNVETTVDVMGGTDAGAPTSMDDTTMNPPVVDTPTDTGVDLTPPEHEDDGGFAPPDDDGGDDGGGGDTDMADAGMAE